MLNISEKRIEKLVKDFSNVNLSTLNTITMFNKLNEIHHKQSEELDKKFEKRFEASDKSVKSLEPIEFDPFNDEEKIDDWDLELIGIVLISSLSRDCDFIESIIKLTDNFSKLKTNFNEMIQELEER